MDKNRGKKIATRHGAYTAVKKHRAGKIDNRSRHGRLLKAIKEKFQLMT